MKSGASIAEGAFGFGQVEQRGRLLLSFERRDERTILVKRFASAPLGAVHANHPDDSGVPEVQITNPSGGILGGDHLRTEVEVAPGASATVITQAANKAYRSAESSQHADFRVDSGAFLEYLPHHLIPYGKSDYLQTTVFHLAPDATLIAWDAFTAGRVARGERFAFTRLRGRTEIHRGNMPEAIDGFDLTSGSEPFGGYSYTAAAYVLAPQDLTAMAEDLHNHLGGVSGAFASASVPAQGLCVVRIMAGDAPALYRALNLARVTAREALELPTQARAVW